MGKKKPSVCEGGGEGLGCEEEWPGKGTPRSDIGVGQGDFGVDGKEGKEGNDSKSQGDWCPGKGIGGGEEEPGDDQAGVRNYGTI